MDFLTLRDMELAVRRYELEWIRLFMDRIWINGRQGLLLDDVFRVEPKGEGYVLRLRDD